MPRRRRRLASRIRSYVRGLLAFLFSNVGVIVLVVGYTIAGAFMFQAIENASEMERANNMTRERDDFTQYLWKNVTLALNLFNETALKERISIELQQYQRRVVVAVRHGWDGGRSSRQWSFSSAFLYSLTVITTIGYGHLSPRTNWGKVGTILYALLGMPLFLLYLSNVGELLARWFKCLYALVCLCRGCPGRRRRSRLRPPLEISEAESIERPGPGWRPREHWDTQYTHYPHYPHYNHYNHYPQYPHYNHYPHRGPPRRAEYLRSVSMPYPPPPRSLPPPRGHSLPADSRSELSSEFSYVTFDAQTITVPISVCVCIMVGYLMFGSMIFGMWEKWDQLDGAYFCFISLSSIGFGDFVPGERVYTPRIETSFIVCSMYLMLGMALVAMCFNLMQEQVIHYFASIKRALQRICRCKRYLMFGSMIFGMWEKWDQLDGAYFCFISLSSIGFGDFVPGERVYTPRIETSFIVCSMYLMLGMALVAMCFNLMQEQVIHYFASIKRALQRICRCKRYLMFGSMIFGMWEKWDQLDGAYFCFISLSSIGFGDFVPGERVYTPRIETSFIVCSMYLMLGMALVAMCFNLMQEQVIHYFASIKRALQRICRCKR